MAAHSYPQETNSQPLPGHAEPGHVHRFAPFGYTQRCIYCHVHEILALRAENADLKATIRRYEEGFLDLYRETGSRYAAIKKIRDMLANYIALAQWPDEQRNDE